MSEQDSKPDKTLDEFETAKDLLEPYNKFREIQGFWRTREAILSGEPLYDFPKRKLEELGLQGPWKFNFIQSTVAGLPSLVLIALFHFVQRVMTGHLESKSSETSDEMMSAFALPFILMLSAFIIGRASFFKTDSTKSGRSVASRAFLYFDGAYGFYPQMSLTTLLTLMLLSRSAEPFRGPLTLLSIWQAIVYFRTIPAELFKALGYSRAGEAVDSGQPITLFASPIAAHENVPLSKSYPPVWKYRLAIAFVIPLITVCVLSLLFVLNLLISPLLELVK